MRRYLAQAGYAFRLGPVTEICLQHGPRRERAQVGDHTESQGGVQILRVHQAHAETGTPEAKLGLRHADGREGQTKNQQGGEYGKAPHWIASLQATAWGIPPGWNFAKGPPRFAPRWRPAGEPRSVITVAFGQGTGQLSELLQFCFNARS